MFGGNVKPFTLPIGDTDFLVITGDAIAGRGGCSLKGGGISTVGGGISIDSLDGDGDSSIIFPLILFDTFSTTGSFFRLWVLSLLEMILAFGGNVFSATLFLLDTMPPIIFFVVALFTTVFDAIWRSISYTTTVNG